MQSCGPPGFTALLSDSFSLYITWQVECVDITLPIVTYFVGICVNTVNTVYGVLEIA